MDGIVPMTQRTIVLMLFIATLTGVAQAILPPDAKAREPQLRRYYQQLRDDYDVQQVERRVEAAQARERVQADIFIPPWQRGEQAVLQSGAEAAAKAAADRARARIRHILISIMFLSLIVGGAGWVWYKTREMSR